MGIVPSTRTGGSTPQRINQTTMVDGVFKGGGSLGAAYPGALRALAAQNVWFRRVAGTSAGSILSCMIAAGFNADEIEFLSAPAEMNLSRPSTLPAALGAHEVDYLHFVDFPTPHDLATAKEWRHSIAWLMARQMVDVLAAMSGPLPNHNTVLDAILGAVAGVVTVAGPATTPLRNAINSHLPSEIRIEDLLPADVGTRDGLADQIFMAGAVSDPRTVPLNALVAMVEIVLAHLGITGGICKGDAFLNRIRRILGAKVAVAGGGPVLFRHLPPAIELFVTATNETRESLIVYSARRTPDMEVAEAVRRSMSVPFVWERRVQVDREPSAVHLAGTPTPPIVAAAGDQIVDGGMIDNLPVWLFLTPTNNIAENTANDLQRPKFVGILDGSADPPASWNAPQAPPATPSPDDALSSMLAALEREPARSTWESMLIRRLMNFNDTNMNGGALGGSVTRAYAQGGGAKVLGVEIPLNGFGWLDSKTTVDKYKAMAFRGWQASIEAVRAAGIGPPLVLATPTNPYR
jgi:predicted acylesterase/phospholipase RssA